MNIKKALKTTALYFRDTHPGLTAEAVLCFLVIAENGPIAVAEIAQTLRYGAQQTRDHLSMIATGSGAGLVEITPDQNVRLTPAGAAAKSSLSTRLQTV